MRRKYTEEQKKILVEILQKESVGANNIVAKLLEILGVFVLLTALLFACGIFEIPRVVFVICVLLYTVAMLFAAAGIEKKLKGQGKWLQYMLFLVLLLFLLVLNVMLNYKLYPLYILPVLLSMRYSSKRFTLKVYVGVMLILVLTIIANALLYPKLGYMDLSTVSFSGQQVITIDGFLYEGVVAAQPDRITMLENGLRALGIPYGLILTVLTVCSVFLLDHTESLLIALYKRMEKTHEIQLELAESHRKLAISQMKPHFLYNTLSIIVGLCYSDPEEAARVTGEFAHYLRMNMSAATGMEEAPFSKELDHMKIFVDIEELRFGKRLKMHYDIQETDFSLPTLTLQPIVENAIKHGVLPKVEGGNVWVASYKEDGRFVISVRDDGVGFDPELYLQKNGDHLGLYLVRSRIEHKGGSMDIKSVVGEGTEVTIRI